MAKEHCHPPCQRMCLLPWVHQSPAQGAKPQTNQPTVHQRQEHCTEHLACIYQQHWNWCWSTHTRATQWSACADRWIKRRSSRCKEVILQCGGCAHKRAQPGKGPWARAQGPEELFASRSEHLSTAANNVGDSRTKITGGCTCMVCFGTRAKTVVFKAKTLQPWQTVRVKRSYENIKPCCSTTPEII